MAISSRDVCEDTIYAVRNWFYTQKIPVGYFAYTHAYTHAYTQNIRKIYNSVHPIFYAQ